MTVRQIENAVALLEYFAERRRPATLADVVEHFGWPRSSAFQILTTLARAGYLYEPLVRGGLYPTPKWLQLATAIAEAEPVPEGLGRMIRRLVEETGETALISAASGQYTVFLDVVESMAPVRYAARPGKRVPIHLTASGLALLSGFAERDREVLLRKATYEERGPNGARNLNEVRELLRAGQHLGYFRSASFFTPDLGGVAVPITLAGRIFAITVAGPLFRAEAHFEEFAQAIFRAISGEFGGDHVGSLPADSGG